MILQFTSVNDQKPGILASLLMQSYTPLIQSDPPHWKAEENNWIAFDRSAFGNPEIVGVCVFLSRHGRKIVGFGSLDPRQRPEIGIIGHNCILPKFRGQGFGKQQVKEILKRMIDFGAQTAQVTTHDNSFFIPAQKMYVSCGFKETGREPWKNDPNQSVIHYQKRIG